MLNNRNNKFDGEVSKFWLVANRSAKNFITFSGFRLKVVIRNAKKMQKSV